MRMNILLVVDMQNDFITGSLANKDAENIVPKIVDEINSKYQVNMNINGSPVENFCYSHIILTRDTHGEDYLATQEGEKLPIEHCIKNSNGWCIEERIFQAARKHKYTIVDKTTFGYLNWMPVIEDIKHNFGTAIDPESITLVGTCTDICVISNALILKALYPEVKIKVIDKLCAGLTPEKHAAAIETMKSCQIEII